MARVKNERALKTARMLLMWCESSNSEAPL
jgi:hypothetical protein